MTVPAKPKIYHILHVGNLPSIISDGALWPDSTMVERKGATVIGNNEIKADRLHLPVDCHPETYVGDYVPFYLCPRSVMLYVISRGNHPNVSFREGQGSVIHLVADMEEVVTWAQSKQRNWAVTDINAANRVADFYKNLDSLDKLDWTAIAAKDWRSCRDHKMAEFLLHQGFPWHLIERIGYLNRSISPTCEVLAAITVALQGAAHRPVVEQRNDWYY